MILQIYYIGMTRSVASWAKVGRELISALRNLGHKVELFEVVEDRYDSTFAEVLPSMKLNGKPDYAVTFCDPSSYTELSKKVKLAGLLVYEATKWPTAWIKEISNLCLVLVPSYFCFRGLINSGIPPDRVLILPHAINPSLYHPMSKVQRDDSSSLRILFVGTPAKRKGLDILLSALERAFKPLDPVEVVIKTVDYSDASNRPYLDHTLPYRISQLRSAGYNLKVDTRPYSEQAMVELYRRADVLCHPFRGEGFGLPLLEAMACGTPVVATAWSGPCDFLDSESPLLLNTFKPISAGKMTLEAPAEAELVEPDLDELIYVLRALAEHRFNLVQMGKELSAKASLWTWEEAGSKLVSALS